MEPIISPFITGYHIFQHMFNKFIHNMLFCTFGASTITRKAIIHIYNTISKTIISTPNAIFNWINKPHIRYINKRGKTSLGLENALTIFVQAKIHGITSANVNPEEMLDNTLSWNINLEQNLHVLARCIQIWKSKVENVVLPNLHLLEDGTKCFVLSVTVKIAKIIMTTINMF